MGPAVASGRRFTALPQQEPILRARRSRILSRRARRRRSSAGSRPSATASTMKPTAIGSASSGSSNPSTISRSLGTPGCGGPMVPGAEPRCSAGTRVILGERRVRPARRWIRVPADAHDAAQSSRTTSSCWSAPGSPRPRTSGSTRVGVRSSTCPSPSGWREEPSSFDNGRGSRCARWT